MFVITNCILTRFKNTRMNHKQERDLKLCADADSSFSTKVNPDKIESGKYKKYGYKLS